MHYKCNESKEWWSTLDDIDFDIGYDNGGDTEDAEEGGDCMIKIEYTLLDWCMHMGGCGIDSFRIPIMNTIYSSWDA